VQRRVEDLQSLTQIIAASDFVVCAMGWTSHIGAMQDPEYDIALNLLPHAWLASRVLQGSKLIYLGSRSQYGDIAEPVSENSPSEPLDVHGINKAAAESYYRIFSRRNNYAVVSLRLPACFGEHQAVVGQDIGLLGNMLRDLIHAARVTVYSGTRMRSFLYGEDCARIVCDIAQQAFSEFNAYNVGGIRISIQELAAALVRLVGTGGYDIGEMPAQIRLMDASNALMDETRLRNKLGSLTYTDFDEALLRTIRYFRKDLAA
jgi:UDP-glucose 4-epimerase